MTNKTNYSILLVFLASFLFSIAAFAENLKNSEGVYYGTLTRTFEDPVGYSGQSPKVFFKPKIQLKNGILLLDNMPSELLSTSKSSYPIFDQSTSSSKSMKFSYNGEKFGPYCNCSSGDTFSLSKLSGKKFSAVYEWHTNCLGSPCLGAVPYKTVYTGTLIQGQGTDVSLVTNQSPMRTKCFSIKKNTRFSYDFTDWTCSLALLKVSLQSCSGRNIKTLLNVDKLTSAFYQKKGSLLVPKGNSYRLWVETTGEIELQRLDFD